MKLNSLTKEEGIEAFIRYNSWVVAVTPKYSPCRHSQVLRILLSPKYFSYIHSHTIDLCYS